MAFDPIGDKAAATTLTDRSTVEVIEGLAPERTEELRGFWINRDVPPYTSDEHRRFLSLAVRALAEKMSEQAEEVADLGRRLKDLEEGG